MTYSNCLFYQTNSPKPDIQFTTMKNKEKQQYAHLRGGNQRILLIFVWKITLNYKLLLTLFLLIDQLIGWLLISAAIQSTKWLWFRDGGLFPRHSASTTMWYEVQNMKWETEQQSNELHLITCEDQQSGAERDANYPPAPTTSTTNTTATSVQVAVFQSKIFLLCSRRMTASTNKLFWMTFI